jgi:hypothetical protein
MVVDHGVACTAPDTCTCATFDVAGRVFLAAAGTPRFQNPDGSAQLSGWTGYDCGRHAHLHYGIPMVLEYRLLSLPWWSYIIYGHS